MGMTIGKCDCPEIEYSFKQLISEKERSLIFQTWNEVSLRKHEIGKDFVLAIVASNEEFKKWFAIADKPGENLKENPKLLSHGRVFGNFINTVVNNISEDFIISYMQQVKIYLSYIITFYSICLISS